MTDREREIVRNLQTPAVLTPAKRKQTEGLSLRKSIFDVEEIAPKIGIAIDRWSDGHHHAGGLRERPRGRINAKRNRRPGN